MITAVVVADVAVDVASSTSSHAAIVATPELFLERCVQLRQPLLLLLELSLKLPKLLQLGLCLPHRWWHGCTACAHGITSCGIGWGVFALILIRGSFAEFPIAHEALSRWVVTLIVSVKTLEKVVAAEKELVQSPPGHGARRNQHQPNCHPPPRIRCSLRGTPSGVMANPRRILYGLYEMSVSPCGIVQPIRPRYLY
jgi:hypothetical protein